LTAGLRELRAAAISSAHPADPARLDNSLADLVQSTLRALDLQDLADPVHPADVPDLAHAPASALLAPVVLVARDLGLVALRQPATHHVRSAHRKIVPAAAASNIRRPKKAR
jgi:hypothetical protein